VIAIAVIAFSLIKAFTPVQAQHPPTASEASRIARPLGTRVAPLSEPAKGLRRPGAGHRTRRNEPARPMGEAVHHRSPRRRTKMERRRHTSTISAEPVHYTGSTTAPTSTPVESEPSTSEPASSSGSASSSSTPNSASAAGPAGAGAPFGPGRLG
jgi:hypothetical protein